jgi:uncharacterized membrane protein
MRKYFSATNMVLLLLCLMYLITYVDRVNMSTAGAAMKAGLGLIVSPAVASYIIDLTGLLPFHVTIGLLALSALTAFAMDPEKAFVEDEVMEMEEAVEMPVTVKPLPNR